MRYSRTINHCILALLTVWTASCGEDDVTREISQPRLTDASERSFKAGATTDERFNPNFASENGGFAFDLPEKWREVAPTPMRTINLLVGSTGEAECYLSMVRGGIEENVNRWRRQMGLPPYTSDEVERLPQKPMLAKQATYVEFEGSYTGMDSDKPKPDYKLVAVILSNAEQAVTVKMIGPKSVLDGELERFDAFCQSLRLSGPADQAHHSEKMATTSGATDSSKSIDSRVPPVDVSANRPDIDPLNLQWTAPDAWKRRPDKAMRLVTLSPSSDSKTECYITVLGGDGGGTMDNINRWRTQMNQEKLSGEEVAALSTVKILGQDCPYVEITGDFTGMAGPTEANWTMLGAVCLLKSSSLFLKMIGPAAEVQAERDAFLRFCESLH